MIHKINLFARGQDCLVKDVEVAYLGWANTLAGKCPHCWVRVRMYYELKCCAACKGQLKWKAPKGYKINLPK